MDARARAVLGVLPFTFHRLVKPALPGFLSTLPLPLAGAAVPWLALQLHIHAASGIPCKPSSFFGSRPTVVWLWNNVNPARPRSVFAAGVAVVTGFNLLRHFNAAAIPAALVSRALPLNLGSAPHASAVLAS
jgi:hypothetical protein